MALRQASAGRGGSRGATAGADRGGCGPIVDVPRSFLSTLKAGCFALTQTGLETALLAGRPHRGISKPSPTLGSRDDSAVLIPSDHCATIVERLCSEQDFDLHDGQYA